MSPENQRIVDAAVGRMLDVIEHDIVPLTRASVAAGNKLFGAAILDRRDLSLVIASVNRETDNPLFHGEVSCLNDFWALDAAVRPAPRDCLFLSTHEPCSMCLSAITWSGFDNFSYFFSYEDSRDAFAIPHDLRILHEVFGCEEGAYRAGNAYWTAHSLTSRIVSDDRTAQAERIRAHYTALSASYQSGKHANAIPLS